MYREALQLTQDAERLGYSRVWTTEHHFVDDGYMPSLTVMSAAMAAITDTVEIATGVLLAPLYHPLRLAEDAATIALIAPERFVLGLGLGWSSIEFEAFDADLRTRGAAMDEMLAILSRAWSGEVVDPQGKVYDFAPVAIRPVPEIPPRIVIGGNADPAIRRAGRLSDGFFSNASPRRLLQQIEVAQETLEAEGRDPADFEWTYYSLVYPCDDPAQGWEEVKEHVWAMRWKYSDMEASAARTGPIATPPQPTPEQEERVRKPVLVGPGEEIAATLLDIREQAGVPIDFSLRAYYPAMSYTRQAEIMARLAEEALPLL